VNHQLRGAESDADEQFVRELARSLDLECLVEQAPIQAGNLEQAARDARRAFFFRLMHTEHIIDRIALGHTASDQAETVLFRLLRGSGLAGLAGMQLSDANDLIRPLLTTSRAEVRDWARAESLAWREDSSNADLRFARNRLRNELMPALAENFNVNLERTLATTALLARAEEDYWADAIEPICRELTSETHFGLVLNVRALNHLHVAIQRRVMRRTLWRVRGNLRSVDAQHIEAVLALCRSEQGHDRVLIPGADALRSFDRLLLTTPGTLSGEKRHYKRELILGVEVHLPFHSGLLCISPLNAEAPNCVNFKKEQESAVEVAYLHREALARHGSLFARNWEPGDQILRPGHQSAEKVKSLFQEHRVVLWERRHWPVVVSGEEIVWVRGFGTAAAFQGSEENRDAVRITYRAE
jgi:tRNA(Ile)-lysidine synthase